MMAYRWIWHTLADPYAPKPGDEAQGAWERRRCPRKIESGARRPMTTSRCPWKSGPDVTGLALMPACLAEIVKPNHRMRCGDWAWSLQPPGPRYGKPKIFNTRQSSHFTGW